MIETHPNSEIPYISEDDGARLWSYAHMNLMIPWFFVHYETEIESQLISFQSMLFQSGHVEQMARDRTISINAIYLVSPGYLNLSEAWSMDILRSLSIGKVNDGQEDENISRYELMNNNVYYYPEITTHASFRKTVEIYHATLKD